MNREKLDLPGVLSCGSNGGRADPTTQPTHLMNSAGRLMMKNNCAKRKYRLPTSRLGALAIVLSTLLASVARAQEPRASYDASKAITVANRTNEAVSYRVAHADLNNAPSAEVILRANHHWPHPENRPLLCTFKSGSETKQYVLSAGRAYQFFLDEGGKLDLRRDAALEQQLGLVVALREFGVVAVADTGYRLQYPQWRERIAQLMGRVSNHFDGNFGIRFKLAECREWDYQSAGRPANESLSQLWKIDPGPSDLVVGFTVSDFSRWQQAELGVTNSFGQHVLIRESTSPALAARVDLVVLHEFCHVFGAFHVDDPRSVMQPALEACPHQFTVTEPTRRVVALARNIDLRRGVESLDEATARQVSQLFQTYRHRGESQDDLITKGYGYQAIMATEKRDWQRAWAMAYQVAVRSPKNELGHQVIGQAALNLDDSPEATNRFREVIRLRPDLTVGHHGLAIALLRGGDHEGALRSAEKALSLEPSNAQIRSLRDLCRSASELQKQLKKVQKQREQTQR